MSESLSITGELFVAGTWCDGRGAELASADPVTGAAVWSGYAADEDQITAAVAAALGAQIEWAVKSTDERVAVLERFADLARTHAEQLAETISRETGKPLWEARQEAAAVAGKVDQTVTAWEQDQREPRANGAVRAVVRRRPLGLTAVLGPFNLPMHLPNGQILPALLAGNAVLFKASERTPACGELLVRLLQAAGVPVDLVQLLQGTATTGATLVAQPELAALYFTGSARGGALLHRQFADRPEVMLALEMGGNNPLVVWDVADADALGRAARLVVLSAFITAGQRCTCARRLIVEDGAAGEAVIEAVVAAVRGVRVGHFQSDPEPFCGPMLDDRARQAMWDRQLEAKGRVITPLAEAGHERLLRPGLIDATGWSLPDEELFGPLLHVQRVSDFAAAIVAANNTRFGLAAGLICPERSRWEHFIRTVRAGVVNWNRQTTGASGALPFGGVGISGNHRPAGAAMVAWCSDPVASLEQEDLPEPGEQPGLTDPA